MNRRVVITGMGVISPLGNNLKTTWAGLLTGQSGAGPITIIPVTEDYACRIGAEVKNFNPEEYLDKKLTKRADRFILFALVAAQEAWEQAGIKDGIYQPVRMGCILGVGIGGLNTLEENLREIIAGGARKCSPMLIPSMISNLAPGNLAIQHGLKGVNYTVTSACTSGTHAVGEAYRMIKDGLQDLILTGGAEAGISILGLAGFGRMKALTTRNDEPQKACRPFDKDRDGFLIAEGAGVLVLEEYEAAKKRGANIIAEIAGYGFSCDAYHITTPVEGGEGAVACMEMAITSSGLKKEEIGYINAHGTSTAVNDPVETAAIKKVFGEHAKNGLLVSSTKSMTGHLLGAAGGLEAIITAKVLQEAIVPPTINLDNPDAECDLDYVPHTARRADITAAISNSFGFGGTNGTLLLKKV
ncbi:MAG: beta-ketoacyl-ACP synthase II [Deltaproteobacteria bacterium]|nr:beta-ketoacyl-ACP synthase II [Deltaproteobacteria bacterium]